VPRDAANSLVLFNLIGAYISIRKRKKTLNIYLTYVHVYMCIDNVSDKPVRYVSYVNHEVIFIFHTDNNYLLKDSLCAYVAWVVV